MTVVNIHNSEHYKWAENADGWHLFKSDGLSVIEERVPSGVKETRHYHKTSQPFFYVLSGVAHIKMSGQVFQVGSGSGLHIPSGVPHQLMNQGIDALRFLVISQPKSHGDRVNV